MTNATLNPQNIPPYSTVFFDFDGTLSMLEGIDYLAERQGVGEEVEAITARCMGVEGITLDRYAQRLSIVQPSEEHVLSLAKTYRENLAPHAKEVLSILMHCGKKLYILSAGIREALLPVTQYLGIPDQQVHAVPIYFDQQNQYEGFDQNSPLVGPAGKKRIIEHICPSGPCALVGDGMNDLEAKDSVDCFIGYGGVYQHEKIMEAAEIFVRANSFLCLLPLLLCEADIHRLSPLQKDLYNEGMALIERDLVSLRKSS